MYTIEEWDGEIAGYYLDVRVAYAVIDGGTNLWIAVFRTREQAEKYIQAQVL